MRIVRGDALAQLLDEGFDVDGVALGQEFHLCGLH